MKYFFRIYFLQMLFWEKYFMKNCKGILTAAKFCLFSVLLIFAGLLAGSALSQGEGAFFAVFSGVNTAPQKKITVVIDAGHGGMDGGAVSDGGITEKDINLSLAKRLRELFALSEVDVVMTREDDIMLCDGESRHKKRDDLENRVKMAKSYENAVFVSIHMNKFPVEKYSGLQVYYSRAHEASKRIAESVQAKTALTLQPENTRKIKPADSSIYVLDNLDIPAVLIECGFLSNRREAALLSDGEYQEKLACIIFASVSEAISNEK